MTWTVWRPRGLRTEPAVRPFAPEEAVGLAKQTDGPQLAGPRNRTSWSREARFKCKGPGRAAEVSSGASFPDLTYSTGHRTETAERPNPEFSAGNKKELRPGHCQWDVRSVFLGLGGLSQAWSV